MLVTLQLFLILLCLPVFAYAQEGTWTSLEQENLLTRETPFSVAVGAGGYIGASELIKLTGMQESYADWVALGAVMAGSYYKEKVIDHAVNGEQASFLDMAWMMGGAGFGKFITDNRANNKPDASLGIKGKKLVFAYNF